MKNYIRSGQKLPLYGIGPYLVYGMGALTLIGILMSGNILKSGIMSGKWIIAFRISGVFLILAGAVIWFTGALRSDMDEHIAENRLKTDGIYSCVRNPMYSGLWLIISGIGLLWHNAWLLIIPFLNWGIMTVVLKRTEEKWLMNLYGREYEEYCRHVNRCVPWFSRRRKEG